MAEAKTLLDAGKPLRGALQSKDQESVEWLQKELQLLTMKPVIYLFNVDEASL